jgi:hypothetical protein
MGFTGYFQLWCENIIPLVENWSNVQRPWSRKGSTNTAISGKFIDSGLQKWIPSLLHYHPRYLRILYSSWIATWLCSRLEKQNLEISNILTHCYQYYYVRGGIKHIDTSTIIFCYKINELFLILFLLEQIYFDTGTLIFCYKINEFFLILFLLEQIYFNTGTLIFCYKINELFLILFYWN